ncbi:pyridoxamine 5'-phosphate oxidase family protein [Nocardioides sp. CPCC 205120]|uniref:pyridoxamine 5'-phosphate oxidase family protein n=1 Tax=Nocardioides sp. CPCC 205120 TaxID=3406462 RepID=UPI003B514EEC
MDAADRNTTEGTSQDLSAERCYELLATTTVGRVAFLGPDGIVLVPVNYRVVDGAIFLRTSPDSSLAALADHDGEVVFEADHHARLARDGWSVVVRGTSGVVDDEQLLASEELHRLVPWPGGPRSWTLRIEPHEVTGRHVHHA